MAQRVYGLALGYEDLNDHEELRKSGGVGRKADPGNQTLAGKSTLKSVKNDQRDSQSEGALQKDRAGSRSRGSPIGGGLPSGPPGGPERNHFGFGCHRRSAAGKQERRFFMATTGTTATYRCTSSAEILLCARLRSSNIDASEGSVEELQRIVEQIRCAWPGMRTWCAGILDFAVGVDGLV